MAAYGFSPATRVFEAAGAGACIITDTWEGIELFFEPGREILVAQNGPAVAEQLARLGHMEARRIGAAERARALADHTYAQRVTVLQRVLEGIKVIPALPGPIEQAADCHSRVVDHLLLGKRACNHLSRSDAGAERTRSRGHVSPARHALVSRSPRPAAPRPSASHAFTTASRNCGSNGAAHYATPIS